MVLVTYLKLINVRTMKMGLCTNVHGKHSEQQNKYTGNIADNQSRMEAIVLDGRDNEK